MTGKLIRTIIISLAAICSGCSDSNPSAPARFPTEQLFAGHIERVLPVPDPPAISRDLPIPSGFLQLPDFNGDGFADLLGLSGREQVGGLKLNRGDGTFGDLHPFTLQSSQATTKEFDDFNGDGITDFILYLGSTNTSPVCLYFVAEDGEVTSGECFDEVSDAAIVSSGDMNEDGIADFITFPGAGPAFFSVFLSDPGGSFTRLDQPVPLLVPTRVLDFDGDGHLDLMGGTGGSDFDLARGNGDGTFGPPENFDLPESRGTLNTILFEDLNGDGRLDALESVREEAAIRSLINNGDDTFSVRDVLVRSSTFDVIDANSDGIPDLVTFPQTSWIDVYLGEGDGTFATPVTTLFPNFVGNAFTDVAFGHLDADGILDVSHGGAIWFGQGDGTFETRPFLDTNSVLTQGASGDLDQNGTVDLVTVLPGNTGISVLLNNGDATFGPDTIYPAGGDAGMARLALIDSDSVIDVIVLNRSSDDISVLIGNGDGTFAPQLRFPIGANSTTIEILDMNGDSFLDVLASGSSVPEFSIVYGDGTGAFGPEFSTLLEEAVTGHQLEDLDGGGFLDLIGMRGDSKDQFSREFDLVLLRGSALGFEPPRVLADSVSGAPGIGDLNADGVLDVVTVRHGDDQMVVLFGIGDGTFMEEVLLDTGDAPGNPALADFNGDGLPDLATPNMGSQDLSIFLNQGAGTFDSVPAIAASVPRLFPSLMTKDMNNDGSPDLVVSGVDVLGPFRLLFTLQVALNRGSGNFAVTEVVSDEGLPLRLETIDVNEDGLADIIVETQRFFREDEEGLSVFLNRGNAGLAPPVKFAGEDWVFTGDLDNDGDFDFVSNSPGYPGLFLMLNRLEQIVP